MTAGENKTGGLFFMVYTKAGRTEQEQQRSMNGFRAGTAMDSE